jgi:hypothetical protein
VAAARRVQFSVRPIQGPFSRRLNWVPVRLGGTHGLARTNQRFCFVFLEKRVAGIPMP